MNLNFKQSEKLVLVLIIFGIISRIIPHPPNFSPVTAIALFSGLNFFNKKIIKPDKQLKNLLQTNDKEEVTYFNIQKFMNKHFVKID